MRLGIIQCSDFENYRAYSPGSLLLAEAIRWSCENGISLFDFSIGSESYKGRWADEEQQLYQHGQAFSVMWVSWSICAAVRWPVSRAEHIRSLWRLFEP